MIFYIMKLNYNFKMINNRMKFFLNLLNLFNFLNLFNHISYLLKDNMFIKEYQENTL